MGSDSVNYIDPNAITASKFVVLVMRKIRHQILLVVFCLIIGDAEAQVSNVSSDEKGIDLYILRHAETLANVTDVYTRENMAAFSEKGQRQVDQLLEKLKAYRFDYILVSPIHRAHYTILPYLEKGGMTAEIWPELAECCWQKDQDLLASASLSMGMTIPLDESLGKYFKFRDKVSMRYYNQKNYAEGVALQKKAAEMLVARFGHSRESVLIVGHYHAGGRLIKILLGLPPVGRFNLKNAALTHLRQRKDGSFQLMMLNDNPYTHLESAKP